MRNSLNLSRKKNSVPCGVQPIKFLCRFFFLSNHLKTLCNLILAVHTLWVQSQVVQFNRVTIEILSSAEKTFNQNSHLVFIALNIYSHQFFKITIGRTHIVKHLNFYSINSLFYVHLRFFYFFFILIKIRLLNVQLLQSNKRIQL